MPFANTAPLRREIETRHARAAVRGRVLGRHAGCPRPTGDGPTFSVRSPRAAAHVLRAPGQLGLGRAYVSGELEVDDIDAVIALLDGWQPPALDGADKRALLLGAVRAAGPDPAAAASRPPSCARAAAATARSATPAPSATTTTSPTSSSSSSSARRWSTAARSSRAGRRRWRRRRRRSSRWSPQAGAEGGRPGARRRLRLGRLPALGGDQARRQRRRHHPLPAPGRESAAAGRGGRRRRPGRDPRHGLPRPRRRALRRDRQHRHGRARRRRPTSTSTRRPWPACSSRAGACSTTASPACATPTPRPAPSPSATSSPTPRRCTSRASCWRWNGPASSPATSRTSAPTTPRRCATGRASLDDNLDEAIRLAGPERVRVWRLYLRAARNGFEIRLHLDLPGPLHAGLGRESRR